MSGNFREILQGKWQRTKWERGDTTLRDDPKSLCFCTFEGDKMTSYFLNDKTIPKFSVPFEETDIGINSIYRTCPKAIFKIEPDEEADVLVLIAEDGLREWFRKVD
jgi:hypothetical protein